ncbi:MAG: glycosyltransferase family 9 protein [Caulobacterales bacterium]
MSGTAALEAALEAWRQGRTDECLAQLAAMGGAASDHPLALQLWALAAGASGANADALALLERAVRLAPGEAQAHFNLAVALQAIDALPRAALHYGQALSLDPNHLDSLNNLSELMRRRGRPAEGWALMERYLAGGGDPAGLEIRLAKLAMDLRRLDEAEAWFQRAEAHAPGSALIGWEHAALSLMREDFARGWPRYERRLEHLGHDALGIYPHAAPPWRGEAVAGRRLLLHREQGLGDMMMHARVFQDLIDEGAALNLAVHPPLVRLMAQSFPAARVWSSVTTAGTGRQPEQPWLAAAGPFDLQAPICSLGALRLAGGVAPVAPYLRADPADVARWAERLRALAPVGAGTRRIGLALGTRLESWNDDGYVNALRRSLTPGATAGLADVAKVRWIGLHDRETAAQLADAPGLSVCDTSPWITDLADTAAIIANLDVVVTADTAVAHVAGAMGKPVLLMLWWNGDWRWGFDRSDSYWYGDVRIFRQAEPGDWTSVVQGVTRALGGS